MSLTIDELSKLNEMIVQENFAEVEQKFTALLNDNDKDSISLLLDSNQVLADNLLAVLLNFLKSAYQLSDQFFTVLVLNKYFLHTVECFSQFNIGLLIKELGLLSKQDYTEAEIKQLLALITLETELVVPWSALLKKVPQYSTLAYLGLCKEIANSATEKSNESIEKMALVAGEVPCLNADSIEDLSPIVEVLNACKKVAKGFTKPIESWAIKIIKNFSDSTLSQANVQFQTSEQGPLILCVSQNNAEYVEQILTELDPISENIHVVTAGVALPSSLIGSKVSSSTLSEDPSLAMAEISKLSPSAIIYDSITSCPLFSCLASLKIAKKQIVLEEHLGFIEFEHIDLFTKNSELNSLPQHLERLMQKPKLSICIPALNRSQKLQNCLENFLKIEAFDIEINISDNGSSDDTSDVAKLYKDKFSSFNIIRNDVTIPIHDNFKQVLSMATYDYVLLFPDDDFPHEEGIQKSLKLMSKNTSLKAVYGGFFNVDENGNIFEDMKRTETVDFYDRYNSFQILQKYIELDLPIIRRCSLGSVQKNGLSTLSMSWNFIADLVVQGNIAITPYHIFYHVNHKEQYTHTTSLDLELHYLRLAEVEQLLAKCMCPQQVKLNTLLNYKTKYIGMLYWLHSKNNNVLSLKPVIEQGLLFNFEHFKSLAQVWNQHKVLLAVIQEIEKYMLTRQQSKIQIFTSNIEFLNTLQSLDNLNFDYKVMESYNIESSEGLWLTDLGAEASSINQLSLNRLIEQSTINL